MEVVHPEFLPDPDRSRSEMEALQREVAATAVFADDQGFDPAALPGPSAGPDTAQATLTDPGEQVADDPVLVGVDQAFADDEAVSAAVALQGGRVVDRATGVAPLRIPYVPGLLSFREGNAVVAALESLSATPDCLVVDGSGRIHYRQAGLATHVGVLFDAPAVGVAKNLLCGRPREPLADPLPQGTRVAIEADADVDAPEGTVVGYAYQSRQYADTASRHVNPLYVSPGHRLDAATAVDVVAAAGGEYKLPEPTRLADRLADELKRERQDGPG